MEALPLLHFNLEMKWCNLWLLFILSLTCFSPYCGACDHEPFICNGHQFEYPFGKRNSGCGDPLLQLQCDNDGNNTMPLLNIKGTQYYMEDYGTFNFLNFSNFSEGLMMTIIDKHLLGNECDPFSSNSMHLWSDDHFRISEREYENITVGKGCQANATSSKISVCNAKFYFSNSSNKSWTEKCKSQVQLPFHKPPEPGLHPEPGPHLDPRPHFDRGRGPNLPPIMRGDFHIEWRPSSSCNQCMSENGMCAYDVNIISNPFVCKHRDLADKPINAVLRGCSIAGGVVVAVCVFLFSIYYVRRRKVLAIQGIWGINNYHQTTDMEAVVGNLPIFTYKELQQATNRFDENNKLGDGGFGTVYLGNLKDGRTVAVKRLYQQNSRRIQQFLNEIKILSSLRHPNLVQLYGCTYPQSPVLLLVYEFVPNGTLADHLHGSRRNSNGLPWYIRLSIAIETAQALSFLHSVNSPIIHRDVKSTNILLDEYYRTKVADFGLSRLVPVDVSHVTTAPQGTPGYVDPEYHQCFQLTEKSDVYSFGVVLVELISAKLAVDITRNRNEISLAYMAIEKIRVGALHELVDPDLEIETNHEVKAMVSAVAELAFRCLAGDRDSRPEMKEVAGRLEDIRLLYERSDSEQQSSVSKEYSTKMPVSSTSVQEEWFSMASENSV